MKKSECFKRNNLLNGGVDRARLDTRSCEINYDVVVLGRGLEPPSLARHGPKPCAYTNSATPASNDRINLPIFYLLVNLQTKTM